MRYLPTHVGKYIDVQAAKTTWIDESCDHTLLLMPSGNYYLHDWSADLSCQQAEPMSRQDAFDWLTSSGMPVPDDLADLFPESLDESYISAPSSESLTGDETPYAEGQQEEHLQ